MKYFGVSTTILAASAALVLTAGAAAAYRAKATEVANVLSEAGVETTVVDQLRRNEQVNVRRCVQGWCLISHTGPNGWVNEDSLERRRGGGGGSSGGGGAGNVGGIGNAASGRMIVEFFTSLFED